MKKIYSLLTVIIAFSYSLFSQIPNANFETWANNTYGIPDPTGWTTYNYGISTATQYQPAQNGTYAVKLTNDTSLGFMLPGSIECYFTTTAKPATFDGYYLAQFASQDILVATVYFYDNAQNPIGAGSINITTSTNTFSSFSVPISYSSSAQPDSAVIVFYLEPYSQTNLSGYAVIDNLSLNGSIGINEVNINDKVNIWPNPANDYLNVSLPDLKSENLNVCVVDLSGRIISNKYEKSFFGNVSNQLQINTSELESGMYFLKITADEKSATKQFVVRK